MARSSTGTILLSRVQRRAGLTTRPPRPKVSDHRRFKVLVGRRFTAAGQAARRLMPGLGLGSRLPVDTECRLVERQPEKLHAYAPLAASAIS